MHKTRLTVLLTEQNCSQPAWGRGARPPLTPHPRRLGPHAELPGKVTGSSWNEQVGNADPSPGRN